MTNQKRAFVEDIEEVKRELETFRRNRVMRTATWSQPALSANEGGDPVAGRAVQGNGRAVIEGRQLLIAEKMNLAISESVLWS